MQHPRPLRHRGGPRRRRRRLPQPALSEGATIRVALLLCGTKIDLTRKVPTAVDDTYGQRYQAGRFLERYYDGAPIATSELGYISLFHDGPITDVFGLGDYEVLQERRRTNQRPSADYWEQLARDRGFEVAVVYPTTLLYDVPESWILAGTWRLDHETVTAWEPDLQFFATSPEALRPLQARLEEYAPELPSGASYLVNELAPLRADALMQEQQPGTAESGGE